MNNKIVFFLFLLFGVSNSVLFSQAIVSLVDSGDYFIISSEALNLMINKEPWYISVYDENNKLITREKSEGVFLFGDDRITGYAGSYVVLGYDTLVKRDPPFYHLYDESVIIGETYAFNCETGKSGAAKVYVTFRNPNVFSIWMTLPDLTETVQHRFLSDATEHFFGLGECWDARSLDLKGLSVTLNNRTGTPDQGGYIPFYLSTRGYGILVDNNLNVTFDFSAEGESVITAPPITGSEDGAGYFIGTSFLYYFYYGPDLLDAIDRFTEHVSRPALPPSWAIFTPWQWRDTNDETGVYNDASGMRDAGIPCGLIWIDRPWAQGADNMPPPFEWQESRYPNGPVMCDDLQEAGFKTGVWVARNLYDSFSDSLNYIKLKEDTKGFLERDSCQMYKIDRGNMQNSDPLFTCQAYFEAWDDVLHGDFVTLPRTIANRAQQYVSGKWPGDNDNTYDYPSGLQANIAVMLNLAMAGFPFWGSDTGGFPDPPGNNVTARWAQFSSFCTIFETAGTPYNYPVKYRNIFRKYAELYTQLFPYRWTYARLAHEFGHPVTRAMVLEYPDDPEGYVQKFEYLYGEWILVAPVVNASYTRDVYLPEGKWYDWWSGKAYKGPVTLHDYPAPEDILPLFIKAGAIIPMMDIRQTWLNATLDPLILKIYPEGESEFTLLGDTVVYPGKNKPYTDLKSLYIESSKTENEIIITTGEYPGPFLFEVHPNGLPELVTMNEEELPLLEDMPDWNTVDKGWYYDPENSGILWIKSTGGNSGTNTLTISYSEISYMSVPEQLFTINILPNPVTETGTVIFNLPDREKVKIELVDMLGRYVLKIADGIYEPGNNEVNFQTGTLTRSSYLVKYSTGGHNGTRLIMVK